MKIIILLFFILTITNTYCYCQDDKDILLQFSGQSITIRKSGENNPMFYSVKDDKLLTFKEEVEAYPDTAYYVVKPKVIIFSSKEFESDSKAQINIRVEYYYQKPKGKSTEIESWGKSYYPTTQKIVQMQDTRNTDGRVIFTMSDKSQWVAEINKDGSTSLFYLTNSQFSYLNFALMFPNCKKEIENGNRL